MVSIIIKPRFTVASAQQRDRRGQTFLELLNRMRLFKFFGTSTKITLVVDFFISLLSVVLASILRSPSLSKFRNRRKMSNEMRQSDTEKLGH